MRHGIADKKFNRDTKQRKALFKSLAMQLIRHGEIVTTIAKAKEAKRIADKLFSTAKTGTLAARRVLHRFFGRRDVVNTLVDTIVPGLGERNSGFTRIVSLGNRRGDSSHIVKLSVIDPSVALNSWKKPADEKKSEESEEKEQPKKKAPAAKKPAAKQATTAKKSAEVKKKDTK